MAQNGLGFIIDLDAGPDFQSGPLVFVRDGNHNGFAPEIFECADGSGKALRLCVQSGAYPGPIGDCEELAFDRCELHEDGPFKTTLGTRMFYGFSLRVPDDFPDTHLRCVVAQIKMPYDRSNEPSPAFGLRIVNRRYLATVEHLYEADDPVDFAYISSPVGGTCRIGSVRAVDHSCFDQCAKDYSMQVRAVLATDAGGLAAHLAETEFKDCTSGVTVETSGYLPAIDGTWCDFVVEIHSSGLKNVDGHLRLYANHALVAHAKGEFGFPQGLDKGRQYFKIGIYRDSVTDWGDGKAAIEVRNLRRGTQPDDVGLPAEAALVA